MARLLRTSTLLLTAALCSTVAAQPAVVLSTDTIFYPAEETVSVTNTGTDTLTLSFPSTEDLGGYEYFYGTIIGYGWYLDAETPDSLYEAFLLPFDDPVPEIALGPDEAAEFRIQGFNSCPACRPAGFTADTLYLRAADETGADTVRVVLDLSGYVSAEPEPSAASPALSVFPNPARESAVVQIERAASIPVRLTLFDALGRRVRVLTAADQILLDLRGLAPGRYVLRADLPDGTAVTQPFTVMR